MTRINVVVEGQAEETFINELLAKHLAAFGVFLTARRVEFGRKQGRLYRGGLINYPKLQKDVLNWLNHDTDARVTTMVDLYALPEDFPGRRDAANVADPHQRVAYLENAFAEAIDCRHRLIPYIQLHEFEAILFTDISKLANYYPAFTASLQRLVTEASRYASPELINEGETSAPSKRILREVPLYDKVTAGSLLAIELTLPVIRQACPHFNGWVTGLEQLGTPPSAMQTR